MVRNSGGNSGRQDGIHKEDVVLVKIASDESCVGSWSCFDQDDESEASRKASDADRF